MLPSGPLVMMMVLGGPELKKRTKPTASTKRMSKAALSVNLRLSPRISLSIDRTLGAAAPGLLDGSPDMLLLSSLINRQITERLFGEQGETMMVCGSGVGMLRTFQPEKIAQPS